MKRAAAALAAAALTGAGALAVLGTAGAGARKAPSRIVVKDDGRGHLPAYRGPESPPLVSAGAPSPEPAPGSTAPGAPPVPAPAPPAPPTPPPPGPGTLIALGVRETETPDYVTVLSRTSIPAGDVTVELQNTGEDPHNLRIIRTDGKGGATQFSEAGPGTTESRTVRFTVGTYRFYCTLMAPFSHDAAGMNATLTVTAG